MLIGPDSVDESFSFLSPDYAAAHGIRLVCDYLSHDPGKDWNAAQIKAYHQAGVGIVFLWETSANRALSGYSGGFADGSDAAGHAQTLINQVGYKPSSAVSIIAAIDFDTTSGQYPVITAYMQGFKVGLAGRFLAGAYGEADILDALGTVIDVGFQTYAWSRGRISARADLYQYLNGQTLDGAVVDFDRIIDAAGVGAWWPPGLSPSGGGTPITNDPTEDDDMGFYIGQRTSNGEVWAYNFSGLWYHYQASGDVQTSQQVPGCQSKAPEIVQFTETQWAVLMTLVAAGQARPAAPGGATDLTPVLTAISQTPAATVAAIKNAL